ncbi:MAG: septal ring lytic transglycosylase RlpA family protein, partial [Burkholderiaceae bacterium]
VRGAPSRPGPTSSRGGYYMDVGPGDAPPPDLAAIPDAVPRHEPLLPRTARPYSVFGRQYTPMAQLAPYRERGMASWYGRRYHGQPTSSGERYDMYAMTAAHPTLPIPSYARVTHVGSGRSVIVRVNDRGPFLQNRIIDLSYTAAAKLGYIDAGSAEVEVELFTRFDAPMLTGADAAKPVTAVPVVYRPGAGAAGPTAAGSAVSAPAAAAPAATASPAGGAALLLASNDAGGTGGSAGSAASSASSTGAASPAAAAASPSGSPSAEPPGRKTVETINTPGEPPRTETRPAPDRYGGAAPAGAASAGQASAGAGVGSEPQMPAGPASTAPMSTAPTSTASMPPAPMPAAPMPAAAASSASSTASASSTQAVPAVAPRPALSAPTPAAGRGYWLQLGAFASLDNAQLARDRFARRLEWLQTGFDVRQDGALFKVQAGPWPRRDLAQAAAERIRAATELQPFMTPR